MSSATQRIDATFAKLPENIREIVGTLRAIIHKAEPSIREAWKWGPCFEKNGIIVGLWGFRQHVSLVFYRGAEMSDKHRLFNSGMENAHNRMIKFTSIKEVNAKKISDYIREAVKVDASGKKSPALKAAAEKKLEVPKELSAWLGKNKKAKTFFDSLSFTYRREMIQHISGAKQETTRKRRFEQVTEALKSGKKMIR